MDWVVFGDDWGGHVSTTQHLVGRLPPEDRIVWINSIGMRSPKLNFRDVKRVMEKLGRSTGGPQAVKHFEREPNEVVHPKVWPWHLNAAIRSMNKRRLGRQIGESMARLSFEKPIILTAYPVPVLYLGFPVRKILYLRLDDYGELPGVDRALVELTEQAMMNKADEILVTAQALFPSEQACREKTTYLPQGVDTVHFAQAALEVPHEKVLGFFGLLAEWLDYELVESVARACPDWTLEFVGPGRYFPARLLSLPNIRRYEAVPYRDLPVRIKGWKAAWAPFRINELTRGVNPLKLREYLAAGLPAICTPLPEAEGMGEAVHIVRSATEMKDRLDEIATSDSSEKRLARRDTVAADDWSCRTAILREIAAR